MKALIVIPTLATALLLCAQTEAATVTLINNDTLAYYNGSLGTVLDGTSDAFPSWDDPSLDFTSAPDLSAAASVLGDWLSTSPSLSPASWTPIPVQVPRQWPITSESAIVYRIDVPANGYTNIVMNFGVDNGVFVWLDGQFLGGAMRPGEAFLGEHQFTVSALSEGTHYLQVLREDHGATDDYLVEVTAETDAPSIRSEIFTAVEITWESDLNGLYQVQRSTEANPAAWTNFGLPVPGDGSQMSVFDRTRDRQYKFYRVLKVR